MNVFSLFASLELDSKGYIQNLKTAERESERTAGAIADRFDRIGEAATRLGQTISLRVTAPIAALATVAVRSFAQQEQAELRLRAALEANGREVDSLFNRYTNFASRMQDLTVIGDEVTIAMLAQAEALGLTGDTAERAITNAIGLSSALGINAESALRYTAVLEEGDTTMLQRYLPALRGVEDQSEKVALAQEMLGNMFSSATAQAASASGQLTQMRNAVGDLAEAFGEIIVGPLLPFVNRLQDLAERAQNMDESTLRLIVQVGALAAAVGPALLVLGQLAFAIRNIAIAFGALSAAMLPLLGAAGVIAAVGGGFYLLQRSFNTNAEAINEQRLFVQDLMSDYAEYRTQLNITSVAEREAALDRMRTIREELRDRLNILEAAAAEETARVEGWLNNPFIKFLLPGFIDVEAGANQGTLAAIEEVRTSLQLLDDDVQALEEGRFILESFSTRPLREADEFVETFGSEYPEALDAATEATDRLDAATRRAMRNQQEFQRLMSEGRDVTGVTPGLGGGPAVGLPDPQVIISIDEVEQQRFEREMDRQARLAARYNETAAARQLQFQALMSGYSAEAEASRAASDVEVAAADRRANAYLNFLNSRAEGVAELEAQAERERNLLVTTVNFAQSVVGSFESALGGFSNSIVNLFQSIAVTGKASMQDLANAMSSGIIAFGNAIGQMASGASSVEDVGTSLAKAVLGIVQQLAAMVLATHIAAVAMSGQAWNPVLVVLGLAGVAAAAYGLSELSKLGAQTEAAAPPAGSVAALREERAALVQERDLATTDAAREELNRQIAEIDERIRRLTQIEVGQDGAPGDTAPGGTTPRIEPAPSPGFDTMTPVSAGASIGRLPQGVQLAVAVPLLDAANAFGSHVSSFGGYIDRLVTEGIAVNMGATSRTAALR